MLLLSRYAALLVHQSNHILRELIQVSTSSTQNDLMRVAKSSILKTLLPTFITGLCLFSNSQNIAWRVLPHVVSMIRKLRDFVSSHDSLREAECAMSKLSARIRDERDVQVVDLESALSNAGPHKIHAVMCNGETNSEDYDGIVIKESGTVVETTKTTPQYSCTYCLVFARITHSYHQKIVETHARTPHQHRYGCKFCVRICSLGVRTCGGCDERRELLLRSNRETRRRGYVLRDIETDVDVSCLQRYFVRS